MGEVDVDDQGLSLRIDTALLGENLLVGQRARENVAALIRRQDQLSLVGGEALRDTFDDIGAAHRLNGREEVVVRDDLEVIVGRRGAAVDRGSEAEDAQATGGTVLRDGVIGVEEGQREEDERGQQDPPVTLAEHQQIVVDRIALPCPAAVVGAGVAVTVAAVTGAVVAIAAVRTVAAIAAACRFGRAIVRQGVRIGHGKGSDAAVADVDLIFVL